MEKEIVRNMKVLKGMEKMGLIKFDEQTGTKITGLYDSKLFTCYYIDEAGNQGRNFTYNNKDYSVEFVSGCFMPYVFKLIN